MLNFQPPSFVKPINYDFGSSLDNIYEQYMKQKLLQSQLEGQSLQQRQLRGQIGMQQGQIGMQNLEQTARFGRPVSQIPAQEMSQASQYAINPENKMNYLEADQTGVSPLTLRPTGNPLHDQLIQGLHAIGQQQQIASQMPQAELELKRSEAIKNRSAAGGYTLDQASSLMSPNGSPEDIAKAKNELASLYPSGVVPKDYAHMGAAAGRSELSLGIRKDQYDQKRLTALGESLDPSKQRAGAFGVSKQVFDRAERLQSLAVASMGNPDRRQMEELAIGLNAMLSGSNTGAQDQVKALVPQSLVGNANKLREWLVNDPTGTGQQEFVKRLNDTIAREKATAMDQIKRTQFQRIGRYADLEQSSPDAFTNALQSNGIEPGEYKAWKSGGYKPMSAVQDKNGKPANDPLGLFK